MDDRETTREARIQACLDRDEIRNGLSLYARAIDRCDEVLLRRIFWPDAVDRHGYFEGTLDALVDWAMPQLQALGQTLHMLGNPWILLDGDTAESETSFMAYHQLSPGGDSDMIVGGRYLDRWQKRGGEWRIFRRFVAYDFNTSTLRTQWSDLGFADAKSLGRKTPDDPVEQFFNLK